MTEQISQPTVESVISGCIELRNRRQKIKAEYEERDKKLKDRIAMLEVWLQEKMLNDKVNAFNTDAGTAYKSTLEHATVSDMDALLDFIKENGAWHLIEKRVSKAGVKAMLDENMPLPPGVNWYTSTSIHVRKPNER